MKPERLHNPTSFTGKIFLSPLSSLRVFRNFQVQYPGVYYPAYIITHEHDTNWVTMPNNVAY